MMQRTGLLICQCVFLLATFSGCAHRAQNESLETDMNGQTNILPITTGTFTQPQAVDLYTPADWEREFAAMQDLGISLWIYQWVGDSKNKTTIYPTLLAGYTQASTMDQVALALSYAQKYERQVFLGLVFNDDWWQKEGTDRDWLLQEAREMNAAADELYAVYFARYPDTFAGWYTISYMSPVDPGHNQIYLRYKEYVDEVARQ
jgi:hypothetical protein